MHNSQFNNQLELSTTFILFLIFKIFISFIFSKSQLYNRQVRYNIIHKLKPRLLFVSHSYSGLLSLFLNKCPIYFLSSIWYLQIYPTSMNYLLTNRAIISEEAKTNTVVIATLIEEIEVVHWLNWKTSLVMT